MSPLQYIREVIIEARQVTWPTKNTLIQLSVVVISLSFGVALILGGFDYLLTNTVAQLTKPVVIQPQAEPTPSFEIATPSATLAPTKAAQPTKKK